MAVSASPGDRPMAEHPADASRAAYDLLPLPVLVGERRGLATGRVFANAAFERLTGVSQRDWRERGHECFLDAASARRLDAACCDLQAGADAEVANLAGFTAAGRPLALRARLRAAADGQRIVIGLDDHSFETAALRAAERREARSRAIGEHSGDVIQIIDADGRVGFSTGDMRGLVGLDSGARLGQPALDFVHPEDRSRVAEELAAAAASRGGVFRGEFRLRHADGSWRWIGAVARGMVDDPAIRGVLLSLRDVTEQREATAALRAGEERHDLAMEAVAGIVYEWDVLTGAVARSRGLERMLGYADSDIPAELSAWSSLVHPDDRERIAANWVEALARASVVETEYRLLAKSGRYVHVLDRCVVQRDSQGRAIKVFGCTIDVTELHRVSRLLEETQELARSGAFDIDLLTGEVRWTQATYRLLGMSEDGEAPTLAKIESLFVPEDWPAVQRVVVAAAQSGAPFDHEARVRDQDGRITWVRAVGQAELSGGRASRVFGAFQDIDNLKRAQLELAGQAEQLRLQAQILATMTEGVAVSDADGRLLFTNPAFDRMFAAPRGSLLGGSVPGIGAALDTAQPNEFAGVRRDGTRFAAASVSTSIVLAGVRHRLSVVQDISERKLLERELIAIASREQERIGHELHDGLGQELTGIALLLRSLAGRVRKELPGSAPELDDIVRLVNQAINNTRLLAGGLSPLVVERGGLGGALQALVDRARQMHGLDAAVEISDEAGAGVDRSVAMQLYRIAQEAVTNVARHAAASRVRITLGADGDRLLLTVSDDGRGMPAEAASAGGLGLRIMNYRAAIIGGRLQLEGAPGKGTLVRVSCPRSPTE